jgi:hypothetical protein
MTIILGPVLNQGPATRVTEKSSGRTLWKKQILPEGKYKYKGTELDLTADTLKGYVQAFKEKAFDEVPFQMGGSESEHNNDPLKRGGTLAHMEHTPGKGVFGYFDFSADPATADYVKRYPRFGVSPRIELGIDRADGKKYAGAIQHVLGTLVPRMNGMDPWSKVELSADANTTDEVIDLSAETYDVEDVPEIDFLNNPPKTGDDMPDITDADLLALRAWKAEQNLVDDLAGKVIPTVTPPQPSDSDVQLSNAIKAQGEQITAMRKGFAVEKWAAQKALLLSQGVPPHAIELATDIMTAPDDNVIELSGGEKTTDKARTLGLLEAMKGTIDLSAEQGHQVGTLSQEDRDDLDNWQEVLGLNNF